MKQSISIHFCTINCFGFDHGIQRRRFPAQGCPIGLPTRWAAEDPRIRVLTLFNDSGPAAAKNLGLSTARGNRLAVLDAESLSGNIKRDYKAYGA